MKITFLNPKPLYEDKKPTTVSSCNYNSSVIRFLYKKKKKVHLVYAVI